MSFHLICKILMRNGYSVIEVQGIDVIALHNSFVHLFEDRPSDPWSWYSAVGDGILIPEDQYSWGWHPMLSNNPDFAKLLNAYIFPAQHARETFRTIRTARLRNRNQLRETATRDSDIVVGAIAQRVQEACSGSLFLFAVLLHMSLEVASILYAVRSCELTPRA